MRLSLLVVLVDHISFSASGGPGLVAQTLVEKQVSQGIDSRFISFIDSQLTHEPLRYGRLTLAAALDRFLIQRKGVLTLGSLSRSRITLLQQQEIRNDSVIHLHWIEGVASLGRLRQLGLSSRRIVWTLHDMAPFTGFCHHSHGCSGFTSGCHSCPQAIACFQPAVEKAAYRKMLDTQNLTNLTIVAPTKWLADKASQSQILSGNRVSVIPNPIRDYFFSQGKNSKASIRKSLGIAADEIVFASVAQNLSDPNKRVREASERLGHALNKSRKKFRHLLVGHGYEGIAKENPATLSLGPLSAEELARVLPAVDILISCSLAESAGMTIVEAGACGVPSLTFGSSGSSELVENGVSGITVGSWEEFSKVIEELSADASRLLRLGNRARELSNAHSADNVSMKYLETYLN